MVMASMTFRPSGSIENHQKVEEDPQGPKNHRQIKCSSKNETIRVNGSEDQQLNSKLGSQENGNMKTTLDLPDALVKQVNSRAVRLDPFPTRRSSDLRPVQDGVAPA